MTQSISVNHDAYGQRYISSKELCNLLYQNPDLDLSGFLVSDSAQFNASIRKLHYDSKPLQQYQVPSISVEDFDHKNQSQWFMPGQYASMDIADWVLKECKSEAGLQRAGLELIMYQERDLFPLLRYMKYLVDTLRKNKVVWGVGRGSSVASYVLYLIGVHRIDSLYYDLDITEFLK